MKKIMIFGGTSEGRKLAELCSIRQLPVIICVATEYGEELLGENEFRTVLAGRKTAEEIEKLFTEEAVSLVIDATHPYAKEVSCNILNACLKERIRYVRLLRDTAACSGGITVEKNTMEEAVEYLETVEGNILVTTGSKDIWKFKHFKNKERLYVRVLPSLESIQACVECGIGSSHLIAMQGPFSEELNYALLKQLNAACLLTKESGAAGGFIEKINAAKRAGATPVVIRRPQEETGYSYEEVVSILGIQKKRCITAAGVGMGAYAQMTFEVKRACEEADCILGAERMLQNVKHLQKPMFPIFLEKDIIYFLEVHPEFENIIVLLSGDVGFYSGAKKLLRSLKDYEIQILNGISSVSYFCGRLHMPWQNVKLLSLHGRGANLIGAVKKHGRVFVLLGGEFHVHRICELLIEYSLSNVLVYVGENLSYENEKISCKTPKEHLKCQYSELSVAVIENAEAENSPALFGIEDSEFIRGKVPMTKNEVRVLSLAKLKLKKNSILYDIGAGTGSVAVEGALLAEEGMVYAVEKNQEAVNLIEENKRKLGAYNLKVIHGAAPEAFENCPNPTHAFIGGSGGNLEEILFALRSKNPGIKIVINAITLETLSEALDLLKRMGFGNIEIIQAAVSKARKAGRYHMMEAQNPVFIISCEGNGESFYFTGGSIA